MGCLSLRIGKACCSALHAIGSSLVQTIFQQHVNRLACAYCKYSAQFRVSSGPLTNFNPLQPGGHYMYRQFNIQQFYVLPHSCICVFCVDLRTNSHYFPIQH